MKVQEIEHAIGTLTPPELEECCRGLTGTNTRWMPVSSPISQRAILIKQFGGL